MGVIGWVTDQDSRQRQVDSAREVVSVIQGKRIEEALREREVWLRGQREALEAAVNGAPLQTSLGALVHAAIGGLGQETRAAFYLADREGTSLHHVVGMPDAYAEAVDGFPIGPESLSCGLATHTGQAVITGDVIKEALWEPWLWLAERFDFRGCWSFPIRTPAGKTIGTLAVYSRRPREATERDLELVSLLTHTASIIISQHMESEARKHAEAALSANDERFRALLMASSEMVYTVSSNWREMRRLHSRSLRANAESKTENWLEEYVLIEDQPKVLEMTAEATRNKTIFELEHRVRRADGSIRWTFSRAVPILNRDGEIVEWFGAASDITARKDAEEALKEAARRKDEFLATLAHELRNPLAPIHSVTNVLRKRHGPGDPDSVLLDMVDRQVGHLVRLVDDLLEINRISLGKIELHKESIDFAAILRDAMETCQPLFDKKGHRVTLNVPDEPLWVFGDPVRLAQVAANLVSNAAKYTPHKGVIEVAVNRDGDTAILRVRDNGVGLPADMLARVFDLFTQIDNGASLSEGGLGIGLALARKLVELHGGSIEAHSAGPGRGSEFVARLPLGSEMHAAPSEKTVRSEHVLVDSHGSPRVLVIDNDHDVADGLGLLLTSLGATARVVYDGLSGVASIDEFKPGIVFVDIGMPGVDGFQTARLLRESKPRQRFILVALTGWGQKEDRRNTQEAGFDLHLTKPASIHALEELLRQAASASRTQHS